MYLAFPIDALHNYMKYFCCGVHFVECTMCALDQPEASITEIWMVEELVRQDQYLPIDRQIHCDVVPDVKTLVYLNPLLQLFSRELN